MYNKNNNNKSNHNKFNNNNKSNHNKWITIQINLNK